MGYTWDLIKVLLVLVGVLFLFYLVVQFLNQKKIFNQTQQIEVLERNHLNSNQAIYLVQVVEEVWLVTATKEKMEFVKKLDLSPECLKESSPQQFSLLNYFKKGTDSKDEE
ncbi:MAG: flagellar biosynthetic protein FliO [Bacillota bacterium]